MTMNERSTTHGLTMSWVAKDSLVQQIQTYKG